MPPVVVLIVCKVILGAPDANSAFTNWRAACPVPVMNDNGTPDNPRDDTLVGWAIPPCPEKRGVLECESDTAI